LKYSNIVIHPHYFHDRVPEAIVGNAEIDCIDQWKHRQGDSIENSRYQQCIARFGALEWHIKKSNHLFNKLSITEEILRHQTIFIENPVLQENFPGKKNGKRKRKIDVLEFKKC